MDNLPEDFDTAPHLAGICSLSFHPKKSNLLLIANLAHQIFVYNINTKSKIPSSIANVSKSALGYSNKEASEDVETHCAAKFNASGDRIAFASVDGHLALLDSSILCKDKLPSTNDVVLPLLKKFSNKLETSKNNFIEVLLWWDPERFVTGSREGIIQIWHTDSLSTGPLHSVPLKPMPDEESEAVKTDGGEIKSEPAKQSSSTSEAPTSESFFKDLPAINDICVSPKRTYVLAATDGGQLFSVHMYKATIHRRSESMGSAAKSVAVVQNGERIALGLEFGVVSLFLWPDIGIPLVNITLRSDEVLECMTYVNNNLLLTAFSDGTLYACCVKPPVSLGEISAHPCLSKENDEPEDACPDTDGVSQLIIGHLPIHGNLQTKQQQQRHWFALTTSVESSDVCFHDLSQIIREANHYSNTHEAPPIVVVKKRTKKSKKCKTSKCQRVEHDDFLNELLPPSSKNKVTSSDDEDDSEEESSDSD